MASATAPQTTAATIPSTPHKTVATPGSDPDLARRLEIAQSGLKHIATKWDKHLRPRVLLYLAQFPGATATQIASDLGCTFPAAFAAVRDFSKGRFYKGRPHPPKCPGLVTVQKAAGSCEQRYSLTPQGLDVARALVGLEAADS